MLYPRIINNNRGGQFLGFPFYSNTIIIMKTFVTLMTLLFLMFSASAQDVFHSAKIGDPFWSLEDVKIPKPERWTKLWALPEHPGFDNSVTEHVKDSLLLLINENNGKYTADSLRTSDLMRIFRPYFDWLRYIDPHYFVYFQPDYSSGTADRKDISAFNRKYCRYLPFTCVNINDTLLVNTSIDDKFKRGDRLLSINNCEVSEMMQFFQFERRFLPVHLLDNYYGYGFARKFDVVIQRGNDILTLHSDNCKMSDVMKIVQKEEIYNSDNRRYYPEYQTGYIKISQFYPNNSLLIKTIRKSLLYFKKNGAKNIILDLRGNPGGNGSNWNQLMGIFIDKDSIRYQSAPTLRISDYTLDYDFAKKESIGHNMAFPEDAYYGSLPLVRKNYVSGLNYYVLMDKSTHSMAASFCNELQFNGVAKLVGEPLMHNALKYGEVITPARRFPNKSFPGNIIETYSTVEYNEYTKAVDGILMPDIIIPYVAKEYMSGNDPMLNKLFEYILSYE